MIVGDGTQAPWQLFKSQLDPHDGSQKSPGHQRGMGCAWAAVTPPKPAKPTAAAIAADAIARPADLFMDHAYLAKLCARPVEPSRRI
ncbi:hypothetical protein GCM10009641_52830 [Mycobacterium cookii]|uniref:Uncharacterized protein n=1 Tax=Mycobacterium cookii TaxID=1775 RepID=A0A7I7KUW5_9MYCO|nr:hypothetical protein MCOO_15340 [Mycobacterium cookii]